MPSTVMSYNDHRECSVQWVSKGESFQTRGYLEFSKGPYSLVEGYIMNTEGAIVSTVDDV